MKNQKFMWLMSLMLVLSVFLAACGGDKKDDASDAGKDKGKDEDKGKIEEPAKEVKQVLNLTDRSEIPSLDSSISDDQVSSIVLTNVMEGLYRLDQTSVPVPAMAESEPEISADGLTYTFKIRDALWSNGTPVTAHDFVFAWHRAINKDTASPYGPYFMEGMIKNATEIGKGTMEISDLGITAQDDKTLVIELERPVQYFLSLMAFRTFYPLNEEFVTAQGKEYATNSNAMIYNGPFVFSDWDSTGNSWKYLKNEKYWDADTVKLDEINVDVVKETSTEVQLYEKGQIDRAILTAEYAMQYADDENISNELESSVFYFKLNQERNGKATPLANVNVRKALARAFNREELADAVLANGSLPADYLVPKDLAFDAEGKDFRDHGGSYAVYNVKEAKEYWEKALKELGTDKVALELLGGDSENAKKQQEWYKSELEKNLPGLTINLKEVPFSVRLDLDNASDFDIQAAGWGADFEDPISYLELFTTKSPQNGISYSNLEYDKLIESTKTTLAQDPVKRWEAFLQAEKILLEEDAAIIPNYQRGRRALMRPTVQGLVSHKYGGDYTYKWVHIVAEEK
ncbi:peptide ABC transporter substrate-binding protein [Sporosarcina limicola]|uniref:Oligopeptide transport system substrate-binding protein n=1 Tax=Sporosarcina limicola TaxID=34101 RepID=A0A927MI08_9BACL|nr:peptide ABC transporter substrate-binding protein [Sporosarcina limicola]MBE1555064.1 oligopeptide transport system substrate-binding protein [Sporosarcina limicola]